MIPQKRVKAGLIQRAQEDARSESASENDQSRHSCIQGSLEDNEEIEERLNVIDSEMASDQDWENSGGAPPRITAPSKKQVLCKGHPDLVSSNLHPQGASNTQKVTATGKKQLAKQTQKTLKKE